MSVTRQLYQLQEIDLQIENNEQALARFISQLGESQTVARARNELASEQKRLEELKKKQHSTEWEIDDLTNRVVANEEKLYSGKITNPKSHAEMKLGTVSKGTHPEKKKYFSSLFLLAFSFIPGIAAPSPISQNIVFGCSSMTSAAASTIISGWS